MRREERLRAIIRKYHVVAVSNDKKVAFFYPDVSYYADVESFEGTYITCSQYEYWLNEDMDAVSQEERGAFVCSDNGKKVGI